MESKSWQVPTYNLFELKPRETKYCLCIPVINEGNKIERQLKQIFKEGISHKIDIIICDGGSTDNSLKIEFLKTIDVRSLLTKTGKGKLSAQLRMGYSYALKEGYEGVITIDGNNKDNVNAIPNFIFELDNNFDFIQGSRFLVGGNAINTPLIRYLAIKLIHIPVISILSGYTFTDTTNGYRGYSKSVLLDNGIQPFRDIFQKYELLYYLSVQIPKLGYKVKEIPVSRIYPPKGRIPTKIKGFKEYFDLLKMLCHLMTGKYDAKTK